MKHIIKSITYSISCLFVALFVGSCDTDVESVEINEPGINSQNSELYAKYLTNLKSFKNSKHKVSFGWFDNSNKMPYSQGQNINAVPDSLDYLVLKTPYNMNNREMLEISDLRSIKGTKVLYEINFQTIKNSYDADLQAFTENTDNEGKSFISFNNYLVDTVKVQLDLCSTYNYDGVVMTFEGKSKIYLDENEKAEIIGLENDFIGIAKDWKERHSDKMLVLSGKPQNVTDQSIFDLVSYIIIPCTDVSTESGMTYTVTMAAVAGVPNNKFVPLVSTYSLDSSDTKTGYWIDNVLAVIGAARWTVAEHTSFDIVGLAIDNIGNDYYNASFTYMNVRNALSIINPTVKN